MENCPICGSPFKEVPAGVSKKTNKPYNAFTACSRMGCSGKPSGTSAPKLVWDNRPSAQKTEPNWEDINFGKCKHAFLVEAYRSIVNGKLSMDANEDSDKDLIEKGAEAWATMSMRKTPKTPGDTMREGYDPAPAPEVTEEEILNVPF